MTAAVDVVPPRRWLVTRQSQAEAEDAALLAALDARARADGARLTVLLLGNAAYDLEGDPPGAADVVALREEVEGRGIRPPPRTRLVSYPELVRLLFESERVMELG